MSRTFTTATTDNVQWASKQASTAITVSAWIKATAFGSTFPRVAVIGDATTSNNTTCNFDQANGRMRFQRPGGLSTDTTGNITATVLSGNWVHVLWTSTGTAGQATLWINGVQQTASNNNTTVDTTAGVIRIGNGQLNNDRPFGGQIAFVSMYNRVLSSANIATLQTNAWLDGDPDLYFASNADVDFDNVTSTAGTVTGTTLQAADNPAITVPGGGAGSQTITTTSIVPVSVFGTPTISNASGTQTITATSIISGTSFGTLTIATVALPAPTSLAGTPISPTQGNLTWVDNATDETAYIIERSPDGSTGWTVIVDNLPANTTSYSDTTLAANTTYYYRCRAAKAAS